MRHLLVFAAVAAAAPAARADWYADAVKSVAAKIEPAEAKPGQTVTHSVTVQLNDGYHTYPVKQPEKPAAAFVNRITYPDLPELIFVGETEDPADADVKAEPELGIQMLRTHHGTVTYRRTAVVSPRAAAGDVTVTLKAFKLTVCDKANCYPTKTLTPAATVKVLPGPAVEVEAAHRAAVEKALAGK
jgi:hypothetical protein